MTWRLSTQDPEFEAQFTRFLAAPRDGDRDVSGTVEEIITAVRRDGDAALLSQTRKLDRWPATAESLAVSAEMRREARRQVDSETYQALELAATRIRAFHEAQRPQDHQQDDGLGLKSGWRWRAVEAAGLYVPGGTAAYPSSVLMNAIPARVAGVERLVMVMPSPDGQLNPLALCAAELAGVDELYRVGGAQAIAALAYGTETIAPVDVIVGPGNAYVATAKRLVFGQVGIDMVAGPSEILLLADAANDPAWLAADLLAQAEHDPAAQSILMSDSVPLMRAVEAALAEQLATLPRREIAAASWQQHGAMIELASLDEAPMLIDRIAPEHLHIATQEPQVLFKAVRNAGSVFLGALTPEPLGDYLAGPNHVLPTNRAARYASGLGVLNFMKRTSVLEASRKGIAALGPAAMALASAEGLDAHARALALRLEGLQALASSDQSESIDN
jgi:histidinol dehydrogenase